MTRTIVLTSGGMDSAVALHQAVDQGRDVVCLEFDHALRPRHEATALSAQVRRLGLEAPRRVSVPFLSPDRLRAARRLREAPSGYVPARNLVFHALAFHHAEGFDAEAIVTGQVATDAEEFPDAAGSLLRDVEALANRGLFSGKRHPIRLLAPFVTLQKHEVVSLGEGLGVAFDDTWSCYGDAAQHCGHCQACVERREAFAKAAMPDPLDV
jgi:7-cyano-7-deazaguanine synthase